MLVIKTMALLYSPKSPQIKSVMHVPLADELSALMEVITSGSTVYMLHKQHAGAVQFSYRLIF
eukprot:jgi/Botrbrau1/18787/Bobra.0386s0103.1